MWNIGKHAVANISYFGNLHIAVRYLFLTYDTHDSINNYELYNYLVFITYYCICFYWLVTDLSLLGTQFLFVIQCNTFSLLFFYFGLIYCRWWNGHTTDQSYSCLKIMFSTLANLAHKSLANHQRNLAK